MHVQTKGDQINRNRETRSLEEREKGKSRELDIHSRPNPITKEDQQSRGCMDRRHGLLTLSDVDDHGGQKGPP